MKFLKRLVVAGLAFYVYIAFISHQMNPLKWDAVTKAVYGLFLIGWGMFIYSDVGVKELWDQIKKEN